MSETRACHGGTTESCRMGAEHAQRCRRCDRKVRDDVVTHWFFGFASGCPEAPSRTAGKSSEQIGD
jgi:hypothetical protein